MSEMDLHVSGSERGLQPVTITWVVRSGCEEWGLLSFSFLSFNP